MMDPWTLGLVTRPGAFGCDARAAADGAGWSGLLGPGHSRRLATISLESDLLPVENPDLLKRHYRLERSKSAVGGCSEMRLKICNGAMGVTVF